MQNEIQINFTGTVKSRGEFLKNFHLTLFELFNPLKDKLHPHSAIMFFSEIVKNIYDHADGKGKATLTIAGSGVCFIIEDFGTESHQFEELKRNGSSKAGNGINYGVGLTLIEGMAIDLKVINFEIDCQKGFKYSGIYPYDITPAT